MDHQPSTAPTHHSQTHNSKLPIPFRERQHLIVEPVELAFLNTGVGNGIDSFAIDDADQLRRLVRDPRLIADGIGKGAVGDQVQEIHHHLFFTVRVPVDQFVKGLVADAAARAVFKQEDGAFR